MNKRKLKWENTEYAKSHVWWSRRNDLIKFVETYEEFRYETDNEFIGVNLKNLSPRWNSKLEKELQKVSFDRSRYNPILKKEITEYSIEKWFINILSLIVFTMGIMIGYLSETYGWMIIFAILLFYSTYNIIHGVNIDKNNIQTFNRWNDWYDQKQEEDDQSTYNIYLQNLGK